MDDGVQRRLATSFEQSVPTCALQFVFLNQIFAQSYNLLTFHHSIYPLYIYFRRNLFQNPCDLFVINCFQKGVRPHTQYRYASRSYQYFTDLMKEERFLDDEYFVQMRLAGCNPMALRKVTLEGNALFSIGMPWINLQK